MADCFHGDLEKPRFWGASSEAAVRKNGMQKEAKGPKASRPQDRFPGKSQRWPVLLLLPRQRG